MHVYARGQCQGFVSMEEGSLQSFSSSGPKKRSEVIEALPAVRQEDMILNSIIALAGIALFGYMSYQFWTAGIAWRLHMVLCEPLQSSTLKYLTKSTSALCKDSHRLRKGLRPRPQTKRERQRERELFPPNAVELCVASQAPPIL